MLNDRVYPSIPFNRTALGSERLTGDVTNAALSSETTSFGDIGSMEVWKYSGTCTKLD